MRYLRLPDGAQMPVLGQGTWGMGERGADHAAEAAALRHGLELGVGLIDTAEMYGSGGAEQVVGSAIAGRRDDAFLVSKVFPHNADRAGAVAACERSLRRMGTDRIDLYLLHWRGNIPLDETLEAFTRLRQEGKIRRFGVSNFDTEDMADLFATGGGDQAQTDQVLYNLTRRGVEFDLLPWCEQRGLPIMAYSPIEQGRLLGNATLRALADARSATQAQIALAWVLRNNGVCAIPKAATFEHAERNREALDISLTDEEVRELDAEFPPPDRPRRLEIL